jgi:hypothetical protein
MSIGNDTVFIHEELLPGSSHVYRVRSRTENNTSLWSESISVITLPAIPENVVASVKDDEITVTWDIAQGADGYDIEVDGSILDNGTKTSYLHTGLMPNTSHTYRVRGWNAAGVGEWSEMLTVYTSIPAPEGLNADATSTTITVSWDPIPGASGYDLLVDGKIVDVGTETSFVHAELEPNSVHVYRVRARKIDGTSGWSAAVVKTTMVGVPSGFCAVSSSYEITLMWNRVEGATVYELEADGELIDVGDEVTYIDKELETGTTHSYRIRARNDNGMGDWSEIIEKKTAPPPPQNLKAEATLNEITLMWDACIGATGYEVEVNGVIEESLSELIFVHSGLEPNTRHTYRVRAVSEDGFSDWSDILDVNTKPELVLMIPSDTIFNFVVVAPVKEDVSTRKITVNYNPDELDIVDLCANTPAAETEAGVVDGTNITVMEFVPGEIVYEICEVNTTVVIIIRFISKTNENSRVSYVIE